MFPKLELVIHIVNLIDFFSPIVLTQTHRPAWTGTGDSQEQLEDTFLMYDFLSLCSGYQKYILWYVDPAFHNR